MTIWKSTLGDNAALLPLGRMSAAVSLPAGARIVHAGMQGTKLCIWSIVEPSQETVLRQLVVVGTGREVRNDAIYIGTVMDGPYVWHVFDISV